MTRVFLEVGEPQTPYQGPMIFAAGHRAFFLLCALSAIGLVSAWIGSLHSGTDLSSAWHGHEMVYGFVGAAISGFCMAAVPKWTSAKPLQGTPVALLSLLWLSGRVTMFWAETHDIHVLWGLIDILYPIALTLLVAKMIYGAKNKRNYIVLVLLSCFALCNVLWHFHDPYSAIRAALYVVLALAALIGGRVVPAFTQNALRMKTGQDIQCKTPSWTHPATMILILSLAVLELLDQSFYFSSGIALMLFFILLYRMWGWHSFQTLDNPIVWVLHAAYGWMPLGFLLLAVSGFFDILNANAALHALSIGAIGLLILAVASRAALGHSGRPLKVTAPTVSAYVFVTLSAVFRVIEFNDILISLSGVFWIAGFILFAIVYIPILTKPRVDGLPG